MNKPFSGLAVFVLFGCHAAVSHAADIFLGSGVKAGEITDRTAIVLVRLTTRADQDAEGLIPGKVGQARLQYAAADEGLRSPTATAWEDAKAEADWSIQFRLRDLKPATRYYYRVEYRTAAIAASEPSEVFSFV